MSPLSSSRKRGRTALICAGLLASAAGLCPGTAAFAATRPVPGTPSSISSAALLTRLQQLYSRAERAAEDYDATREKAEVLRARIAAQGRLPEQRGTVAAALRDSARLARQQRVDRDRVEARVAEVKNVIASLSSRQLARLAALEQRGVAAAQQALLSSGRLGAGPRMPSAIGRKAVAYAYSQLGKPYAWGSAGPDSFDCSGLTSQAWAHAGRRIPRTSQGQWARLRHVPLNRLRPGDLVVYYRGATHVAIYVGGGRVVQAPRPGSVVKVTPLASNPVLGAVRPDSDRPSVPRRPRPHPSAPVGGPAPSAPAGGPAPSDDAGRTPAERSVRT